MRDDLPGLGGDRTGLEHVVAAARDEIGALEASGGQVAPPGAGGDDGSGPTGFDVLGLVRRGNVPEPRPAGDLEGHVPRLGAAVIGVVEHGGNVPATLDAEPLVGVRV